MIYLKQNLFSLDRKGVREGFYFFMLFQQEGEKMNKIYFDLFIHVHKNLVVLLLHVKKSWRNF